MKNNFIKAIVLVLFCWTAVEANAQMNRKWTIGVKGGWNWTNISRSNMGRIDETYSPLGSSEYNFFAKYAIAPPPLIHQIKPTCAYDIENFFDISHEAASYAFRYYNVWLKNYYRKCACYNNYEKALLKLFENFFCKRCGSSYEVICL